VQGMEQDFLDQLTKQLSSTPQKGAWWILKA
jgi:hypothetical protein